MVRHFLGHNGRAILCIEDWQRNTPDTLTGDYPVTTVPNHIVEAGMAP